MNKTRSDNNIAAEAQLNPSILEFVGVGFVRSNRPILDGITWSLPQSGIGAILGPNGSGKSTLLRMAAGYVWPTCGQCYFNGRRLGTFPVSDLRKQIAVVEPAPIVPMAGEMTTLDVICSGLLGKLTVAYDRLSPRQYQHATHTAELVGLRQHLRQPYETLSTGEKMRAMLARGLIISPQLLILDECTNGLDIASREAYLATIRRISESSARPAILVVTHYPEELPPNLEHILLLTTQGSIQAAGDPKTVMTGENFSAAFNWPVNIRHHNGRYISEAQCEGWTIT